MTNNLATKTHDEAIMAVAADLIEDAGRGTENIGTEDVRPPRILICQANSPYRKPGDAKQIKGLNELDIFNDLSGDNYGQGPLKFCVLHTMKPRYVEFNPMEDGGGVKDFNVPAGDPRTQFTTNELGEREKPVATMFRDFLVFLPEHDEVAVLSMKGSQLKVAIQLNSKMKLPLKGELIDASLKGKILIDPPAWARTFSVTTIMERDTAANTSWGNYQVRVDGLTPRDVRDVCRQIAADYAEKNIIIEHEQEDDEATSFNTAKMDAEARVPHSEM
jgi:hypothetical protein